MPKSGSPPPRPFELGLTAGYSAFDLDTPTCTSSAPSTPTPVSAPTYCQPPPGVGPHLLADPTVLGHRNGEVRRIRSVLELRLGPLACSLDKSELLASSVGSRDSTGSDSSSGPSTPPRARRRGGVFAPPRRIEYDMFGIEIPHNPAAEAVHAGVTVVARTPSELDLSALMC